MEEQKKEMDKKFKQKERETEEATENMKKMRDEYVKEKEEENKRYKEKIRQKLEELDRKYDNLPAPRNVARDEIAEDIGRLVVFLISTAAKLYLSQIKIQIKF